MDVADRRSAPLPLPTANSSAAAAVEFGGARKWLMLAAGIVCMAMIANLQYGWTLFVDPIAKSHHWTRDSVQWAFFFFVLTETWLVPVKGYFTDRYGPRTILLVGALLIAAAWVINSYADQLAVLYLGAVVGGFGAAAIYGTCVGNALKWFPDRRGLAAGATAAGFGAGAALTVVPIGSMIATNGYKHAFFVFGIGQGIVVALLALVINAPKVLHPPMPKRLSIPQAKRSVKPNKVVRQPVFWLLYLIFVMVAAGGLMTAAQLAPIAADYGIAKSPVALFGITAAAMLLVLGLYGREPIVFVLASALYFLVFGEIYSLFPATCGDTFGSRFATTNAGLLYTAKGVGALLVPLASTIARSHGWQSVFMITVALNTVAAVLAFFVLKPLRARYIANSFLMN